MVGYNGNSFSGESEVVVITRPKGGKRSLCMDMEEVKVCRDLGFELEIPSRFSSFYATSSGGTSPITNWPISDPGESKYFPTSL